MSGLKKRQRDSLRGHDGWPAVRRFLRAFLRETLGAPHVTAGELWAVSAMPGAVQRRWMASPVHAQRGRIEAVYIGEDAESGAVRVCNVTSHTPELADRLEAAS